MTTASTNGAPSAASRSRTFYELLKLGLAPKTMKLKKRRTITSQADAEWQAQRERETEVAA